MHDYVKFPPARGVSHARYIMKRLLIQTAVLTASTTMLTSCFDEIKQVIAGDAAPAEAAAPAEGVNTIDYLNDDSSVFMVELTSEEINILAILMMCEWL